MTERGWPARKLEIAMRGVRIDASARGLAPASEPLPQSLELLVAGDAPVSVPVDAAGTAPMPLLLVGADGRYWITDPEGNDATRLPVQLAGTPRFYGRRTSAGVPMRIPLVTPGFWVSKGIEFLFTVIPAMSSVSSATLPVSPFGLMSTSIRWLSVPPETSR